MESKRIRTGFWLLLCFALGAWAQSGPTFYLRGFLNALKRDSATVDQRKAIFDRIIPKDIRANTVYCLFASKTWYYTTRTSDYTSFTDDSYLALAQRMDEIGVPFVVSVGEPGNFTAFPEPPAPIQKDTVGYRITPAQVEKIFRNTRNCVGIESGENFWTYSASTTQDLLEMLRVCKKYNKRYVMGEGGWGYNSFMRLFADHGATIRAEGLGSVFVPVFKNTKPYGAFVSQSALLGAWMTGLASDYGTWNDEWVWTYASFGNANEFPKYTKADNTFTQIPYTHYLKSWLLTISNGGGTAFLETPSFLRSGQSDANFAPYLYPFIKGLAEHAILPRRNAILARTKAMANPHGAYTLTDGSRQEYMGANLVSYQDSVIPWKPSALATAVDPFGRLYRSTYGVWQDTTYTNVGSATERYYGAAQASTKRTWLPNWLVREQLPNTSRYGLIPVVPFADAVRDVPAGVELIALNQFPSDSGLTNKFHGLYPDSSHDTGAYALEVDSSFFVINSHENADIDQSFALPLGGGGALVSMQGVLPVQNIVFGKREGLDNFWFQSNGYAVRNGTTAGQKYVTRLKKTQIRFRSLAKPTVTVENGLDEMITQEWSAQKGELALAISHLKGAVNFRIRATAPVGVGIAKPEFHMLCTSTANGWTIAAKTGSQLRIHSVAGEAVLQRNVQNGSLEIDNQNWRAGVYYLVVEYAGHQEKRMLLKP